MSDEQDSRYRKVTVVMFGEETNKRGHVRGIQNNDI